jgi:outer membrane protein assembly factor BamA
VETDRRAIEAAYQELGFLAARVTPELLAMTPDSSQVDLGWSIDEGRRTLVGTLVITGADGP